MRQTKEIRVGKREKKDELIEKWVNVERVRRGVRKTNGRLRN